MKWRTACALGLLGIATAVLGVTACGDGGGDDNNGDGQGGDGGNGPSDGSGGDSNPADPCDGQTCSGHGTCSVSGGVASCSCEDGYTPADLACVVTCERTPTSCFEGPGEPAGSDLVVSLEASRTSGVAPLAVFFDATGSTSTATERPFHDLSYCWSFGDGNAGCYGPTGAPKDQARGPVAAHVFEEPGTYDVTVTVRDADNREASETLSVTVTSADDEFADNTVCISPSGNFDGCPDGAATVTGADLAELQDRMQDGARRLLLHRGETFTVAGNGGLAMIVPGPGIIGAYGEGDPPTVNPENYAFSVHSVDGDEVGPDWRVMDIDVDGLRTEGTAGLNVNAEPEVLTNFLMLRTRIYNVGNGLRPGGDGFFVADSEVRDVMGGQGTGIVYAIASRMAFLGSLFFNSTEAEHVLRLAELHKAVVSSCELGHADEPRHVIKLHGPEEDGMFAGEYTEQVVFTENRIIGTGGHAWTVSIGAQNSVADERLRDIIFDGNYVTLGPDVGLSFVQRGFDVTLRNNVFYCPGEAPRQFIQIERIGVEPPPERIHVVNNTAVVASGERRNMFVAIGVESVDILIANNLVTGPTEAIITSDNEDENGALNTTFAGNLATTDPGFDVIDVTGPLDLAPPANSEAVGAADPEYACSWDFSTSPRPAEQTVGALEPTQ